MQIEVNIDDELLAVARSYVSTKMPLKALLLLALKTYVRVQKTKRLSALGGAVSEPQDVLDDVPSATSGSRSDARTYWSTMDSRGRVTVPAAIRAHLGAKPGDRLIFDADGYGTFQVSVAPKPRRKRARKL